jgi:hypothetical protein
VGRKGSGDKPNKDPTDSPFCLCARIIHQAQGNKTALAPKMRAKAMSSGNKTCADEALATMMNEVQMKTVITADKRPTFWGDKTIGQ